MDLYESELKVVAAAESLAATLDTSENHTVAAAGRHHLGGDFLDR